MSVRGSGIFPSGTFRDGTLSVSLWSKFQPFQELGFEFELGNPSNLQLAKQISVSVSDSYGLDIPSTKAFGNVLRIPELGGGETEEPGSDASQVFARIQSHFLMLHY
jgi:hypothetical protein